MNTQNKSLVTLKDQLISAEENEKTLLQSTYDEKILLKSRIIELREMAERQIRDQEKKLDYRIVEKSISLLVQKYTDFLDTANPWSIDYKSKFIESIFLGLPIKQLIVTASQSNPIVIDGTQRITALREFVENDLELTELHVLTSLNGFKFKDFSQTRQSKFNALHIRFVEISQPTSFKEICDLFSQVNYFG